MLIIFKKIIDLVLEILVPADPEVKFIEISGIACFEPKIAEYFNAFFLLPYRNSYVKTALIEIKNNPNKKIADILGQLLFEAVTELVFVEIKAKICPLVLPIPITDKKKRERGWNQCELILDGFKKIDINKQFEARKDILIKIRENADQVGMSRSQRFENLKNCFAIASNSQVANRTVIIFDDILTTGATLGDARRALVEAGAGKVICIALAH